MLVAFAWFVEWLPFGERFVLVEFDESTPTNRYISAALGETEVRGLLRDHGVPRDDIDAGLASARIRADADRFGLSHGRHVVSTAAPPRGDDSGPAGDHERPATRRSGS